MGNVHHLYPPKIFIFTPYIAMKSYLGTSPPPPLGPRPEEPSPASARSMGLDDGYVYEAKKRTVTLDVSN